MTTKNGAGNGTTPIAPAELEPVDGKTAAELATVAARALNALSAPPPAPAPIGKLAKAIAGVIGDVERVEKRGRNDFHKYDYAKASDIEAMIGPKLAKHGLVLLPTVVAVEPVPTYDRDGNPKPSGDTVDVHLDILLIHESGEQLVRRWIGRGQDRGDKALNKCYTVALKTFIERTFHVPTGDDPEADTTTDEDAAKRAGDGGTNGQLREAAGRRQSGRSSGSRGQRQTKAAEPAEASTDAPADDQPPDLPSPDDWRELFELAKSNGYDTKESVRLVAATVCGSNDADNFRLASMDAAEFAKLKAEVSKPAADATDEGKPDDAE